MATKERFTLEVGGHEVSISSPNKVYFPDAGHTKLDLARYYLAVAEGALRGAGGRPMVLKRFVRGIREEAFFQKRAPAGLPEYVSTAELRFPSGRSADEVVIREAAGLAWLVNLGCVDLNPHPVRAEDLEHPDELRIDLDPVPGVPWSQVREVALVVREVLEDHKLVGWPKTSGSRGIHINVRIAPRYTFDQVRDAALAFAREVERRAPSIATSKWWKEERHGVFLDYNQNAKDRTTCSAYSVRPREDARVSMPLRWEEVAEVVAEDFTLATVPALFASRGDAHAGLDEVAPAGLEGLLELAEQQKKDGAEDAPWPPHHDKREGEPPRVAPSRAKRSAKKSTKKGAKEEKSAGRAPRFPLLEIAKAKKQEVALAGLERWKARHPEVAALLDPADILVDTMRGRSSTWTRIRVNLKNVPEDQRPPQEPLESDYDPWASFRKKSEKSEEKSDSPKKSE